MRHTFIKKILSPYPWSLHAHQQDHSHHPSSSALLSVSRNLRHPQDPASSTNNMGVQALTRLGGPLVHTIPVQMPARKPVPFLVYSFPPAW